MRAGSVLFVLLLCLTFLGYAPSGQAQVSVDMRALDGLGGSRATPAPVRAPPARARAAKAPAADAAAVAARGRPNGQPAPAPASQTQAGQTQAGPTQAGPTPGVPPVAAVTPPVPALPVERPAAPPESTMTPPPAASPTPLPAPVRLVFEDGKTDLTPGDEAAIRDLAHAIPAPAASSINVVAYAAGKPDDPSTARRLSLSRGMAVRSVLLASGVPSAQIYVRALGSTAPDGPADQVELIVARLGMVTR